MIQFDRIELLAQQLDQLSNTELVYLAQVCHNARSDATLSPAEVFAKVYNLPPCDWVSLAQFRSRAAWKEKIDSLAVSA